MIQLGWFVRIYVNSTSVPDASISFLQEHFQSDSHVDVCNVTRALECRGIRLDVFPMTWRFLPLLDPTVVRMMSRDTDSLVTDREVAAVKEWIESNTSFHIMRDNANHCAFILGGKSNIILYDASIYLMNIKYHSHFLNHL